MWQGTNTHAMVHNVIKVVYYIEIESPLWLPIDVLYPSNLAKPLKIMTLYVNRKTRHMSIIVAVFMTYHIATSVTCHLLVVTR